MKERLLDVIKWGLILVIAGAVFYVVCPKYYFELHPKTFIRANKITGKVEGFFERDEFKAWRELKDRKVKRNENQKEKNRK